jgi:pyruvate dehydrogenase E2 component (dihydrolipoamide acetyltransferase)
MEVPVAYPGRIRDVKVRAGDKVSQGDVLAIVETTAPVVAPPAPVPFTELPVVHPPSLAPALSNPPAAVVAVAPVSAGGTSSNGATNGHAAVHASPAIRRFARELGVNLGGVRGSGPNGRITRDDVQGFVKQTLSSGVLPAATNGASNGASTGGLQLLPWPKVDFAKFGPIERVPLTRIQKLSGPNLARNWVLIPHVTQNDDADVTELEAFRQAINAEQKDGLKVTMLALMIKASVAALKQFPTVNSSLDGDELVLKGYYNIGFAADTPGGLVVPVIRDADRKGVLDIARETGALAKKARDGKLGAAEMTGATFTISSLGGIGGTSFTPIINAPEVAILGACRTAVKPVWDGKAFQPRTILPLSFSYDHRVIDGASAARFTSYLATVLADMRRTLL